MNEKEDIENIINNKLLEYVKENFKSAIVELLIKLQKENKSLFQTLIGILQTIITEKKKNQKVKFQTLIGILQTNK